MRRAIWREHPATETQKTWVESYWKKAPKHVQGEMADDAARSLRIQSMTKGDAAHIITRIKHGAMVSILFDESCAVVLTCPCRVDTSTRWKRWGKRNRYSSRSSCHDAFSGARYLLRRELILRFRMLGSRLFAITQKAMRSGHESGMKMLCL